MSKKYKLSMKTLVDIFEKIPLDRIEIVMEELTQLLVIAKGKANIVNDIAKKVTKEKTGKTKEVIYKAKFPEQIEWIDDEKGDCKVVMRLNKKHKITTTWHNKNSK